MAAGEALVLVGVGIVVNGWVDAAWLNFSKEDIPFINKNNDK